MSDRGQLLRWVVIGLAGIGAGAFALTAPKDNTRFVSARPPASRAHAPGGAALAPSSGEASDTQGEAGPASGSSKAPADPEQEGAGRPSSGAAAAPSPAAAGPGPLPAPDAAGTAERRDLFRPLVVAKQQRALPPASLPPMPAEMDGFLPLPEGHSGTGKRQRSYWQYVGTVQLDGVTYALVEEKKSKTGLYLKRGDAFRGGVVESLQRDYLVLSMGGRRYTLPKSSGLADDTTGGLTPATAPAAGQPAAQAAGAPWMAAQAPGGAVPPGTVPYGPGTVYPGGYPAPPGTPGAYPQAWPGMPQPGWPGAAMPDQGAQSVAPSDGGYRNWRRRRRDYGD